MKIINSNSYGNVKIEYLGEKHQRHTYNLYFIEDYDAQKFSMNYNINFRGIFLSKYNPNEKLVVEISSSPGVSRESIEETIIKMLNS